ncbi:MAG: CinA family protein [Pontibacterium sp.]
MDTENSTLLTNAQVGRVKQVTRTDNLARLATLLLAEETSVSCAESCTGGLIAAAFTSLAGSSAWFEAGFVTYSNKMKTQLLGVDEALFVSHGAVSEPVVLQMAQGALRTANAGYSVAVSGIAGPGGGSEEKPVGTVCFGFSSLATSYTVTQQFMGNREEVREATVDFAIASLIKLVESNAK